METSKPFTAEDMERLLAVGEDIMDIDPVNINAAWESWAHDMDVSAEQLTRVYESITNG